MSGDIGSFLVDLLFSQTIIECRKFRTLEEAAQNNAILHASCASLSHAI
jgi:hypothetical protein